MKKLILTIMMVTVIALMAVPAQANVTYSPYLTEAYDALGDPIENGTCLVVMDLDGDGWGGISYFSDLGGDNASEWLWDVDDLFIGRSQIEYGVASPCEVIKSADIPSTYDEGVDKWYVLWFDMPYSDIAVGPGAGINYGVGNIDYFTGSEITAGADPGTYSPYVMGGNADLTTVPEPISAVLMLIGAGMLGICRRFNRVSG